MFLDEGIAKQHEKNASNNRIERKRSVTMPVFTFGLQLRMKREAVLLQCQYKHSV